MQAAGVPVSWCTPQPSRSPVALRCVAASGCCGVAARSTSHPEGAQRAGLVWCGDVAIRRRVVHGMTGNVGLLPSSHKPLPPPTATVSLSWVRGWMSGLKTAAPRISAAGNAPHCAGAAAGACRLAAPLHRGRASLLPLPMRTARRWRLRCALRVRRVRRACSSAADAGAARQHREHATRTAAVATGRARRGRALRSMAGKGMFAQTARRYPPPSPSRRTSDAQRGVATAGTHTGIVRMCVTLVWLKVSQGELRLPTKTCTSVRPMRRAVESRKAWTKLQRSCAGQRCDH